MKISSPRRLLIPSKIFLSLYSIFLLAPALFIYIFKHYENLWVNISFSQYDEAARLFLLISIIGFFSFFLGLFFTNILFYKDKVFVIKKFFYKVNCIEYKNERLKVLGVSNFFIITIASAACLFTIYYIFNSGLEKMSLLGSGLSPKEFRFSVTFEDSNSVVNNFLQIARRIFFPLAIVFLSFCVGVLKVYKLNSFIYYFFVFLFLISCLITLDRAPLITFAVVFLYLWLLKVNINYLFFLKILFFVFIVMILGGVMTYIQHNIINFTVVDVFLNGFNFLWHRVWAAPSIVAIELSTNLFPESSPKLSLQFSRLGVLVGLDRVGSQSEESVYVGPVSYLGDAWRNFGYLGVFSVSFFLGSLFSFFDFFNRTIVTPYAVGLGILTITFIFYLTHGVFFSMGVFFQMLFMICYCIYAYIFFKKRVYI